jgi:NAD(P)-dependent dehydrogenase (short-subunit alcohol dehydrogenase family)
MGRVEGRVAIVTGAAQGLGATYARALAAEGAKIVIADRDSGEAVAEEIRGAGGEAIDVPTDVSSEEATEAMVAKAVEAFGRVDVLVNNAAIFTAVERKPFTEIPVEEWDLMHDVNVKGTWLCCKAAVPEMRKNGYGKIVNISTSRFFQGVPFFLHYDSTKGAIIGITRSLCRELGDDNICVNCIAPGSTLSENVVKRTNWMGSGKAAQLANRSLKREEFPEDLVGAVLFLSSAESDFVTGQTLLIDGGITAH